MKEDDFRSLGVEYVNIEEIRETEVQKVEAELQRKKFIKGFISVSFIIALILNMSAI